MFWNRSAEIFYYQKFKKFKKFVPKKIVFLTEIFNRVV